MATIDKNYVRLSQLRVAMQKAPRIVYATKLEISKRNKEKINKILSDGYDIDYAIPEDSVAGQHSPQLKGYTALHFAVTSEELDVTKLLLSKNADIRCQASNSFTPLRLALEFMKHLKISKDLKSHTLMQIANELLIAHWNRKDSFNPTCCNGISHFHIACMLGSLETVNFYLKAGVDVNQVVNMDSTLFPGFTPLHFAVQYGHKEVVRALLNREALVELQDGNGMIPLQLLIDSNMRLNDCWTMGKFDFSEWEYLVGTELATLYDNDIIMDMLMPGFNQLEPVDESGLSYFHAACTKRNQSGVKKLLEMGADVNKAVSFGANRWPGYTPLHFAARCNQEIMKLLLQNGANIEAKDANGITAFDLCVERFSPIELSLILKTQPSLNTETSGLMDMLKWTPTVNMLEALDADVDSHIDQSSRLWPGYTLLHLVVVLSKRQIKFDRHYLVQRDRPWEQEIISCTCSDELVKVCLMQNPKLTVREVQGLTALELAFRLRKVELFKQLLMAFAKALRNVRNPSDKLLPFHAACAADDALAVQAFLESGMDPNSPLPNDELWFSARDSSELVTLKAGSSLFHTAAIVDAQEVLKICRQMDVDVNVLDADGLTPAQLSFLRFGSRRTLQLLLSFPEARRVNHVINGSRLSQLHVACYADDYDAVEELLNAPPPNHERERIVYEPTEPYADRLARYAGYTPLHFAVESNAKDIVDLLLRRGHDVFARNDKGLNALHLALLDLEETYKSGILTRLINLVINDDDFDDDYGITRLHLACAKRDELLIRGLSEFEESWDSFISFDSPIYPGDTPHHFLARHDRTFSMFNFQADLNMRNADNLTPLHMCKGIIPYSYVREDSDFRTPFGVNHNKFFAANPKTSEGISHFHISCFNSWHFLRNYLIARVDVNEPIDHFIDGIYAGFTPLHIALMKGDEGSAKLLLEYGADILFESANGSTPLQFVGSSSVAKILIVHFLSFKYVRANLASAGIFGSQINFLKSPFDRSLKAFIYEYERRKFNQLIKTECFRKTEESRNFIYMLAQDRDKEFAYNSLEDTVHNIRTIVQITDCDLDYTDREGRTALHRALLVDNCRVATALLCLGAEVDVIDNFMDSTCNMVKSATMATRIWQHCSKMIAANMHLNRKNRKKDFEKCPRSHNCNYRDGDCSASRLKQTRFMTFTLYEMLSKNFLMNFHRLPISQRKMVTSYFTDTNLAKSFPGWEGIFMLQRRRLMARLNLLEHATNSLCLYTGLPSLCGKMIVEYLCNEDLTAVSKL